MLQPTNLASDYPLSFENSKAYLWSEIPEEAKVEKDGLIRSYDYMNYSYYTAARTERSEKFLLQVSS